MRRVMTTNAFIFMWDIYGIESVIPITQYEEWDKENTWRALNNEELQRNPINNIIQSLLLRARFNPQRNYEIYAVDCSSDLDEDFWWEEWRKNPQGCADIVRTRGQKIFSDRSSLPQVIS
jgi:hypothetical protein